jgi:hypothetical protein
MEAAYSYKIPITMSGYMGSDFRRQQSSVKELTPPSSII